MGTPQLATRAGGPGILLNRCQLHKTKKHTCNKSCKHRALSGGRQWECEQSKAEHWRGGARTAGAPATWRYILRCVQLLATLNTHGISRSVPYPSSPSAYAQASPLSPCWPAPRHTHTQSRPNDHPLRHQVITPIPTRTYYFETRRSVVGECARSGEVPPTGVILLPCAAPETPFQSHLPHLHHRPSTTCTAYIAGEPGTPISQFRVLLCFLRLYRQHDPVQLHGGGSRFDLQCGSH
jgi:hypothetical protein